MQFCEICHSIMRDGICSNRRCTSRNEALASWIIDGTLYRFRQPVTLTEAQKAVRDKSEIVYKVKPPPNRFVKMPTW
jgi:hypothetical protein